MTTTITLTTHSWPVKVITSDRYELANGGVTKRSNDETEEVVAPNSTRSFYITDTRSIRFEELPMAASDVYKRLTGIVDDAGTVRTDQGRAADEELAKNHGVDGQPQTDPDGEEIDPSLRA